VRALLPFRNAPEGGYRGPRRRIHSGCAGFAISIARGRHPRMTMAGLPGNCAPSKAGRLASPLLREKRCPMSTRTGR